MLGLHLVVLNGYRTLSPRHVDSGAGRAVEIAYLTLADAPAPRSAVSEGLPLPALATTSNRPAVRAAEVPVTSALSKDGAAAEEFIDARLLTLRPAPTEFVALPQPELNDSRKSGRAVFSLFVNREGRVMRVRVDSSTLPDDVQLESEQVFFRTSFRPGMLGGQAVGSRLEVEVVFDSPSETPGTAGEAVAGGVAPPRI